MRIGTMAKAKDGKREPTSRDVAKALDIAQSTVSRAFTSGASISPELRARIHAAAEEIGYRPNLLARGLIAGRSGLIGVVIAPQTNLLYPEMLYELGGLLAERNYQLLLFPAPDADAARKAVTRLRAYRVDAVLATGVIAEAEALAIEAEGVPLVTFNRLFSSPISGVSCDFAGGASALMRGLLASGHRRFGVIAGPGNSFVSGEVECGISAALVGHAGVAVEVVSADYQYESAGNALAALERKIARPSALICVNDTVAAGCVDRLRSELGSKVPEDVSVVSFATFAPTGWHPYRLTGMRQPMKQMISAAVDLLLSRIADHGQPSEQRLFMPAFTQGATAIISRVDVV